MDGKDDSNGELARETLLCCWSGRGKNLTFEEKKRLELFFQTGKVANPLVFSPEKMVMDPVFAARVERALQKYGDVVLDIINDIYFGFPEDGLNEPVSDELKK